MKLMLMILFSLTCLHSIRAQFNWPPMPRCSNPNQNAGICVSIYDCQSLMSLVQNPVLQPKDAEFIKASECAGTYGQGPHVCCTGDTGYVRRFPRFQEEQNYWDSPPVDQSSWFPGNGYNNYPQFQQPPRPQTTRLQPQQQQRPWSFGQQERRSQPTLPAVRPNPARRTSSSSLIPQSPVCGGIRIANKIIGGLDADLNEFPWMALLEYKRRTGQVTAECGGSLINKRYILTAAHCVTGAILKQKGPLVAVRFGEHDTTQRIDCNHNTCAPDTITVGVEEIIPYEQYEDAATNKEHDIALVRLDRDISFSDSVSPICLPSRERQPKTGSSLTVVGWGSTLTSPKSPILQKLSVKIADQRNCQSKFQRKKVRIADTQLCAGGKYAQDSCSGDSGGPLMHFKGGAWTLEGIVSFGFKCGLEGWPAVYTRVASYDDWIRSKVRA